MINYIEHKCFRLRYHIKNINEKTKKVIKLLFWRGKTVYLFGYPNHPNAGDLAQAYCIEQWLQENYADYKIFTFYWRSISLVAYKMLKWKLNKEDILCGHSGYIFHELHLELPSYNKIATDFKNNKIIIFPVTINISDQKVLSRTINAINSHPDLTLLCRDELSYSKAQQYFKKCRLLLYPDIVTSLIGLKRYDNPRNGALFCMRDDLEKFYSNDDILELKEKIQKICRVDMFDTTINVKKEYFQKKEKIINEMLYKFSTYRVVITDRYHGTIFSLITATPVVVLATNDHKVSSGVLWFPESFKEYVYFAKNLEEAYNISQTILDKKLDYILPSYFKDKFYSTLKDKFN